MAAAFDDLPTPANTLPPSNTPPQPAAADNNLLSRKKPAKKRHKPEEIKRLICIAVNVLGSKITKKQLAQFIQIGKNVLSKEPYKTVFAQAREGKGREGKTERKTPLISNVPMISR